MVTDDGSQIQTHDQMLAARQWEPHADGPHVEAGGVPGPGPKLLQHDLQHMCP